jgi:putative copper export protein
MLLRACIQIAHANLKLRMQKPHAAARLWSQALTEVNALGARKAAAAGDGFADSFPTAALAALLQAKLGRASLTKADWVPIGSVGRT